MDREIAQLLHRAGEINGQQLAQALERNAAGERMAVALQGLGILEPLQTLAALQNAGASGARCECGRAISLGLQALTAASACECGGAVRLSLRPSEVAPPVDVTQEVPPARRCGRYELREQLGAGSFGAVWRAWDPVLSREVALKQLLRFDPNTRQRFEREVKVTARLDHSNIVRLLDHGDERGRPFLVMELIEGPTLEALARGQGLPPEQAVRLVLQIAQGIHHAHERGVLHRDLKPENVLVRDGTQPKIVDFGLARLGERRSELTRSGTTLGTPHYMAPEQAGAEGIEVGKHTDLYALGGVLYFCLTGRPPLEARTEQEMWMAIFRRMPEPPSARVPQVPKALDRIVLRCLEKEPKDRYGSVPELIEVLSGYLAAPGGERRLRIFPLLVGAVAVTLLAAAAFALSRSEPPPEPKPVVKIEPPPPPPEPPAPQTGTLKVRVVPAGQRPEVTATSRDGAERRTVASSAPLELPPGGWRLTADANGWLPALEDVEVVAGGEREVVLRLLPRSLWTAQLTSPPDEPLLLRNPSALPAVAAPYGERLAVFGPAGEAHWVAKVPVRTGPLRAATHRPGEEAVLVTADRTVIALAGLGRTIWKHDAGSAVGALSVADLDGDGLDEVLIPSADGRVAVLDAGQGKLRWTAQGSGTQRVVVHRSDATVLVLCLGEDGALVAYDAEGNRRWLRPPTGPAHAPRLLRVGDEPSALLPLRSGRLVCLGLDGETRWTFDGAEPDPSLFSVDLGGDGRAEVALASGDGAVAIDGAGAVARRYPGLRLRAVLGAPTGTLLVGTSPSGLEAVDLAGSRRWTLSLGGKPSEPPLAADLDGDGSPELIARTTGALHCVSAAGDHLWREPLAPGTRWQHGDLDGDGVPELLVTEGKELKWWAALRPTLRWRGALEAPANQVTSVGPHVIAWPRSGEVGYGWTPATDAWSRLQAPANAGRRRPVWDARNRRAILPARERLFAWTPGLSALKPLSELRARVGGLACAGDLLLAGTQGGRLHALSLDEPTQERWSRDLPGRLDGAPLPLDLDGDGQAERILITTSAASAHLLDRSGKVLASGELPAPVSGSPQPLAPRARDGAVPVLLPCDDGRLLRLSVRADRLEQDASWDLGMALSSQPAVIPGPDGAADLIVVGTWNGWLHATDAQLRPRWSSLITTGADAVGDVVAVDLDQDGSPEIASSWLQKAGAVSAFVRVHSRDGHELLRLFAGGTPFYLARGAPPGRMVGAGQVAFQWGPWPVLRGPLPSRRMVTGFANLCGGAWEAAARFEQETFAGRVVVAIAAERRGQPDALRALLREDRASTERQIDTWARQCLKLGNRPGAERLLETIGRRLRPQPALPHQPLPVVDAPGGETPLVDLSTNPAQVRSFQQVSAAGITYDNRHERKNVGAYFNPRGGLKAVFKTQTEARLALKVRHRVLRHHMRGNGRVEVLLDGRPRLRSWAVPREGYRDEYLLLGSVPPGVHEVELRVSPRSPTLYSLLRVELVPVR